MSIPGKEPYRSLLKFFLFVLTFNGIVSLLYLLFIWMISESTLNFFKLIHPQIKQASTLSIFINIVFFLFISVLNINTLKLYLFSPSMASEEQIVLGVNEKFTMGYAPLLFASVVVIILFLLGYFVQGLGWNSALSIALTTVLPFLVALGIVGLGELSLFWV